MKTDSYITLLDEISASSASKQFLRICSNIDVAELRKQYESTEESKPTEIIDNGEC